MRTRPGSSDGLGRIEHDAIGSPSNGLRDQLLEQPVGRIDPFEVGHILHVGRRKLDRDANRAQFVRETTGTFRW